MTHRLVVFLFLLLVITLFVPHHQYMVQGTDITDISLYFDGIGLESYLEWYQSVEIPYTGSIYLPSDSKQQKYYGTNDTNTTTTNNTESTNSTTTGNDSGIAIHWRVDTEYLYLAMIGRHIENGWIAVGLAEAGGMKGSDIVIYESSNPTTLFDAHVLDELQPIIDDCQHWIYINSNITDDGFLIVEGKRLLDTEDPQDHKILNDTDLVIPAQRIIAAWGESDTMMYHGSTNRARGGIRWYGDGDEFTNFQLRVSDRSSFVLRVNNHTIAANETIYSSFCFNWYDDLVPQGILPNRNIAITAIEFILDNATAPFVHHATFYASTDLYNASSECVSDWYAYNRAIFFWTPGVYPFELPPDTGIILGPGNVTGLQSFQLRMHYDNPQLLQGLIDNSGVRVYYTITPPKYEVGLMGLGDVLTSLEGTPVYSGTSRFDFACGNQCSTLALDEPVTVISELFHMHKLGVAGAQYQIRNGEVVHQSNVNFFDFDQAGVYAIRQEPFQILPGDSFHTTCFYQSEDAAQFGFASSEEMCDTLIMYYPAKRILDLGPWSCIYNVPFLSACNATFSTTMVTPIDDEIITSDSRIFGENGVLLDDSNNYLSRTFGYRSNQCEDPNTTFIPEPNITIILPPSTNTTTNYTIGIDNTNNNNTTPNSTVNTNNNNNNNNNNTNAMTSGGHLTIMHVWISSIMMLMMTVIIPNVY